ncbi:MAG TPA: proline-rich domain-containing protein [Candidatus Binataceae bacterium]|nr:proline-rich domain-containing protein [Candidatus Binataceae bacterium]
MAINPVQVITASRKRIARNAAIRAAAYFIAPALTGIALGALLPAIGAMTWQRMGYIVAPEVMIDIRVGLIAAGFFVVLLGAYRGWSSYRTSDDFVGAAIEVDRRVHAHEQVVTLATLSESTRRGALVPVLWRNVMAALSAFDPDKEFVVRLDGSIKQSMLPASLMLIAAVIAMIAFMRTPTPLEQTAIELQKLAAKIDSTATTPDEKQLAEKIRHVAANLTNSKVPPTEKEQELEQLLAEVEKKEPNPADQAESLTNGKGSGEGKSSSAAKGGSEGKGSGGQSQGQGKGAGKGEGKGSGGNQQNANGNKNGQNKGGADSIELRNELAKAKAQVQTEDLAANQAPNKPSPDAKTAQAPQPGDNPNQKGGSNKNPNQKGSAPMPIPQNGNGQNPMANGEGPKPKAGGTNGDTHLGEFPTAANYQRFVKPGEKGMGINLNDARYVVFRIPSAMGSGDEGKTVIDTEAPRATTAYTNAPLAPTSDTAPPDERQLVPPRYRDLIR